MTVSLERLAGGCRRLRPMTADFYCNPRRWLIWDVEPNAAGRKLVLTRAKWLRLGTKVIIINRAANSLEIENRSGSTEVAALAQDEVAVGYLLSNSGAYEIEGLWWWRITDYADTNGGGTGGSGSSATVSAPRDIALPA